VTAKRKPYDVRTLKMVARALRLMIDDRLARIDTCDGQATIDYWNIRAAECAISSITFLAMACDIERKAKK
jgi:hypothetical protein